MKSLAELSDKVAAMLRERGQTVAVAESSTGGLISASLLAVPGASAYFVGGSVIYTRESRKQLLGVTAGDVAGLEPLTEAMAAVFAQRAREQLGTTWGLVELGAAGPSGTRYGHPPGLSVIAVDGPVRRTVRIESGSAEREANMWHFTARALALLETAVAAGTPASGTG
ncbi:MAG: CinA family protein [Burkholderiaceae bacterium]